ncbi:hypothetical protein [Marinicella litoralis]|uniref:Uncharacterized protein n=1 Tax=Marinicella litoralis TaxID=644220 RepID=A0A4R6XI02_9GAMM|nr:hypothetical protein [Marinicella litoralis]TDR17510.1 hypothetical protein C8D91_2569 [Marinicella litoralis]
MDVVSNYTDFLSVFMALIIVGVAVKLALESQSDKTYEIAGKNYSRQKVHTAVMLGLMGLVIQIVSNSIKALDGKSLLFDEKILAAYLVAILVMASKK